MDTTVTTWWPFVEGEKIAPPFPEQCCHCLQPAAERLTADFDGVEFHIPYCQRHMPSAREYIFSVVRGKKRAVVRKISMALAILAGFWIVFAVLPESDLMRGTDTVREVFGRAFGLAPQERNWHFDMNSWPLWTRIVLSLFFSFIMIKIMPHVFDRSVLQKGAYRLGYWVSKKVTLAAPGIVDVAVEKPKKTGDLLSLTVTFLNGDYAEAYKNIQPPETLRPDVKT
ncbi:MAG: hypothetical protein JW884_13140 [Deltaproteobacteria bacterium]|nr:hypothetical protein [Deltaproteobacteria bacterium]